MRKYPSLSRRVLRLLIASGGLVFVLQVIRARILQILVRENGRNISLADATEFVSFATICNLLLPTQLGSVYLAAQIKRTLGSGILVAGALRGASLLVRLFVDSLIVLVGYRLAGVDEPLILAVYGCWLVGILVTCVILNILSDPPELR